MQQVIPIGTPDAHEVHALRYTRDRCKVDRERKVGIRIGHGTVCDTFTCLEREIIIEVDPDREVGIVISHFQGRHERIVGQDEVEHDVGLVAVPFRRGATSWLDVLVRQLELRYAIIVSRTIGYRLADVIGHRLREVIVARVPVINSLCSGHKAIRAERGEIRRGRERVIGGCPGRNGPGIGRLHRRSSVHRVIDRNGGLGNATEIGDPDGHVLRGR